MPLLTLFLSVLLIKIANGQDIRFATDCTTPNNAQGLCIDVQECGKLYNNILQNKEDTFAFIRASRCGPINEDSSRPKVCCGEHDNYIEGRESPEADLPPRPSTARTTTTIPSATGHAVLPRICGKQKIFFEHKVIGGREASVGEYPWLARLVHLNEYNRTGLGCGGFLIHRKFVLTAAHCLRGKGIEYLGPVYSILLGVHNDTKARICDARMCTDPPQSVDVREPIVHKEYDQDTHENDIALIPLNEKVNFTDFIKAICLSPASTDSNWFFVSGWGRTETDATSRTKLKVELPRYSMSGCVKKYKSLGLKVTESQICAGGEKGHDSCSGDSGGPLMAVDDTMVWYAEGIVSYGNSCGRDGWPGVYTYIPNYYNWIVNNIKDNLKSRDKSQ